MPASEEFKGVVDVGIGEAELKSSPDAHLQRKLGGKEVQLFAIGGAIGTSRLGARSDEEPSIDVPAVLT